MHKSLSVAFLLTLLAGFTLPMGIAHAGTAAAPGELSELLENLANADTELEGHTAEEAVWNFWFDQSPSADVRAALDAGMKRREAYDFEAAENHLSQVVELAPNYAEGYNQRAFVRFLREKYNDSLLDLEKALELEPNHFGALSGLFQILRRQDRHDAAYSALKQAVTLHPWLRERSSLPEHMWPERYRALHSTDQGI